MWPHLKYNEHKTEFASCPYVQDDYALSFLEVLPGSSTQDPQWSTSAAATSTAAASQVESLPPLVMQQDQPHSRSSSPMSHISEATLHDLTCTSEDMPDAFTGKAHDK